jgi:hypothetical protein
LLPLVKDNNCPLTLAVTNALLAEVNKDAVADCNELTLWSFDAVYALNEDVVTKLPALPLTSGIRIPNVLPSPFVNVSVCEANDAVVNPKLADVNKLAVAEFKFVIDELALALFAFKAFILICCEADEAFN